MAKVKKIAILSDKGGAGKSMLALQLAVAADLAGEHTVVLDLDPQGSATAWRKLRGKETPVVVPTEAKSLKEMIDVAAANAVEVLIIDTAPHDEDSSRLAAKVADLVLVPCRPGLFDVHAIARTVGIIRKEKKPARVVLIDVPTRGRRAQYAREAVATYDLQTSPYELGHRVAYVDSLNEGKTAAEYQPKSKAAEEVKNLYNWLMMEVL